MFVALFKQLYSLVVGEKEASKDKKFFLTNQPFLRGTSLFLFLLPKRRRKADCREDSKLTGGEEEIEPIGEVFSPEAGAKPFPKEQHGTQYCL